MRTLITTFLFITCFVALDAQNELELGKFSTFSGTRCINGHSVEVLEAKNLDIRITHRFGDVDGPNGSVHTLWGLDQSSDIRIGIEYGINDQLMVGLGRSKGGSIWREVFDLFAKYQLSEQSAESPVTVTVLSSAAMTGMEASPIDIDPVSFKKSSHRVSYYNALLLSRKFTNSLSLQGLIGWSHRNYVDFNDENDVVALSASIRYKIGHKWAFVSEYYHALGSERFSRVNELGNSLSFGMIYDVGGHIFQLDITNARGIGEHQFVPMTIADWADGEYRFGFTISRPIKL